jgi:hypothetical protein
VKSWVGRPRDDWLGGDGTSNLPADVADGLAFEAEWWPRRQQASADASSADLDEVGIGHHRGWLDADSASVNVLTLTSSNREAPSDDFSSRPTSATSGCSPGHRGRFAHLE